jgi:hypothetical protein
MNSLYIIIYIFILKYDGKYMIFGILVIEIYFECLNGKVLWHFQLCTLQMPEMFKSHSFLNDMLILTSVIAFQIHLFSK